MILYAVLAKLLLKYDARHTEGCPQRQQNYWRMRPEYHPDYLSGGVDVSNLPIGEPLWEFSIDDNGMKWGKRVRRYGPDRVCNCGLDEILGKHDDRSQG